MTGNRPARGHTLSHLKQLLAARGIRPRQALGQCFLIDLNILDILEHEAQIDRNDFVLEVGTGTGSLTERLAAQAGRVLTVELDRNLYALAEDSLKGSPNVTLLSADVLEHKNSLNPQLIETIRVLTQSQSNYRRKLVSNLPYSIATPLIALLLMSEFTWDRFVVTIQKEVAERLTARPSTKDYGSLSVLVQAISDVEIIRELSPSVFWPRPAVSSAIVRVTPSPAKRARVKDLTQFHHFVRGVMLHRRKNLRRAIDSWLTQVPKGEVDEFLQKHGVNPQVRAESLSVEQFIELGNRIPSHWQD